MHFVGCFLLDYEIRPVKALQAKIFEMASNKVFIIEALEKLAIESGIFSTKNGTRTDC